MGAALLSGFLRSGLLKSDDVVFYDKNPSVGARFGISCEKTAHDATLKSDTLFLCVKPKDMDALIGDLTAFSSGKLFVSIAAGISTSRIEKSLDGARVIRVMPNTPALVGKMAAAYCLGTKATEKDAAFVERLLSSLGVAYRLPEKDMDAVTGLSGSGPAYVYLLLDAMVEGAKRQGMDPEIALKLAVQTFIGAAEMVSQTCRPLGELIDEVRSPGGTTAEGLKVLMERNVPSSVVEAVEAATRRSRQLGK
jgi:pyrroline-5-carboxylate reductase